MRNNEVTTGEQAVIEPMPEGGERFTIQDWLLQSDSAHCVELIDGSLVMYPAATTAHQVCAKRLVQIFDDAAPADIEIIQRANVPIGMDGAIPDIVVGDADALISETVLLHPRHIRAVIEIVSPVTSTRDYHDKPQMYATAGIPTFIRVELTGARAPRVEALTLSDWTYIVTAAACAGTVVHLSEPFTVSFDPGRLTGTQRRD